MRRYSTSLVIREMQAKATMTHQNTLTRMAIIKIPSAGENEERLKPTCIAGGNVKRYSHFGKPFHGFIFKWNINLPFDSRIPLLGIYARDLKTYVPTKTCIGVFIAALLIIAPKWK